jgi:hypothetical protein
MPKIFIAVLLLCATLSLHSRSSYAAARDDDHRSPEDSDAGPVNPVVQWNKTLLLFAHLRRSLQPFTLLVASRSCMQPFMTL